MDKAALVWFRLDLRLADNPALSAAAAGGRRVVPVFIWAPEEEGAWPPGAASRWWLHHSLQSLDAGLRRMGSHLTLRRGPSLDALRSLIRECGADAVYWNRRYEPAARERDARVENALLSDGVRTETFNSALLFEPSEIRNRSGMPFQVFTPFWNSCLSAPPPCIVEPPPRFRKTALPPSLDLGELSLDSGARWTQKLRSAWQPGETGAHARLERFLGGALEKYPDARNVPAVEGTSRLSPYLHFGEISPRRIMAECARIRGTASQEFVRQLGWRDFANHLLFHFPETAEKPLRAQFLRFRWRKDPRHLEAWQRARTGYPLVDAGMRELWDTGWMHNRVRMVAGSFLTKDLLLSWTEGARWFWDTLVDADLANNTLGWQWVAGCGADAAPYWRIFNPDAQTARFDPKGEYIRRWAPEAGAPEYAPPIVDHSKARERALDAFSAIKRR